MTKHTKFLELTDMYQHFHKHILNTEVNENQALSFVAKTMWFISVKSSIGSRESKNRACSVRAKGAKVQ